MSVPEAKRLKAEEMKDGLLKKLVADPSLGEQRLQGVIDHWWWCAVNWLRERCEVSMLRACQVMKLPESICRRRSWRYEMEVLRAQLVWVEGERPRFGYLRLHVLSVRKG